MTDIKKQVIELVDALPNNVTLDDIMAELYFKLQVDIGLKELDEGKGIPHDKIREKVAQWQKK